jgi:hypothetical protein
VISVIADGQYVQIPRVDRAALLQMVEVPAGVLPPMPPFGSEPVAV